MFGHLALSNGLPLRCYGAIISSVWIPGRVISHLSAYEVHCYGLMWIADLCRHLKGLPGLLRFILFIKLYVYHCFWPRKPVVQDPGSSIQVNTRVSCTIMLNHHLSAISGGLEDRCWSLRFSIHPVFQLAQFISHNLLCLFHFRFLWRFSPTGSRAWFITTEADRRDPDPVGHPAQTVDSEHEGDHQDQPLALVPDNRTASSDWRQ